MVFMQHEHHHIIPTWHEWNMNANDIMMVWFALYVNTIDVTLGAQHACMCMVYML